MSRPPPPSRPAPTASGRPEPPPPPKVASSSGRPPPPSAPDRPIIKDADSPFTVQGDKAPGYNMSWYCFHSLIPIPGGCKSCYPNGKPKPKDVEANKPPPSRPHRPTSLGLPGAKDVTKEDPAKLPRPGGPPKPAKPAGPPKPIKPAGPPKPLKPAGPPKPLKPAGPPKPIKPAGPSKPASPAVKPSKPPPPKSTLYGSGSRPPLPKPKRPLSVIAEPNSGEVPAAAEEEPKPAAVIESPKEIEKVSETAAANEPEEEDAYDTASDGEEAPAELSKPAKPPVPTSRRNSQRNEEKEEEKPLSDVIPEGPKEPQEVLQKDSIQQEQEKPVEKEQEQEGEKEQVKQQSEDKSDQEEEPKASQGAPLPVPKPKPKPVRPRSTAVATEPEPEVAAPQKPKPPLSPKPTRAKVAAALSSPKLLKKKPVERPPPAQHDQPVNPEPPVDASTLPGKPNRPPPTEMTDSAPQPDKPSRPVKPKDKPGRPDQPESPTKPIRPVKPESPTKPSRPIKPESPTKPSQPDQPESPTKPIRPVKPESPTKPSRPIKPESPTKKPSRPGGPPPKPQPPKGPPALPPRPGPGHILYHYMLTGPRAIVVFDWDAQNDGDLSLKEGDIVLLKQWRDPEWLEGDINGNVGIFPVAFVDIEEDIPVTGPKAVVLFDFDPANDKELSLGEGEEVALLGRVDEEWLRGRIRGQEGLFPASFVEILEDLPEDLEYEGWPEDYPMAEEDEEEPEVEEEEEEEEEQPLDEESEPIELKHKAPVTEEQVSADAASAGAATLSLDHNVTESTTDPTGTGLARGLYDYEGEPGDLSFKEGTEIIITAVVSDEWLEGRVGDVQGIFPIDFVEIVTPFPGSEANNADVPKSKVQPELEEHNKLEGTAAFPDQEETKNVAESKDEYDSGSAVALYDYEAAVDGDLPFVVGDEIIVLKPVGEDWLEGQLGNTVGIFPRDFVDVVAEPTLKTQKSSGSMSRKRRQKFKSKDPEPATIEPVVVAEQAVAGANISGGGDTRATGKAIALYDFGGEAEGDLEFYEGEEITLTEKVSDEWYRGRVDEHREGIFPVAFVDITEPIPT